MKIEVLNELILPVAAAVVRTPTNRRVLRMSKVEVRAAAFCSGGRLGGAPAKKKKKMLLCNYHKVQTYCGGSAQCLQRPQGASETMATMRKGEKKLKQNQYSNKRARQLGLSSVLMLSSGSAIKASDVYTQTRLTVETMSVGDGGEGLTGCSCGSCGAELKVSPLGFDVSITEMHIFSLHRLMPLRE